jgi:branched-chain amino acid transport system substrate-binding protein
MAKSIKKLFGFAIAAFMSCLLAVACTPTNNTTSTTPNSPTTSGNQTQIPIGIAVAQTSNVALLGQEQVTGAKIAEAYFNKNGGINAFNTLISQDKVVGIVGPTLSQQAFSADPIAERAGVPVIAPSNTAKGIPQIGKYIARVSAPVAVVAPNAIDAALKINPQIKKVAVFFAQNDAFSKSETGTFQETVKQKGLDLATVQTFQTTDTDFQSQVTNAINIKPDLIIISGLSADGGNLVKQLRELGYKGLIIGGNGLNTSNLLPVCKALCDGIIIAQAYSPEMKNEVNTTFRQLYIEQNKKEPPQFTAQAFTGVQVFVEALKTLDKTTKLSMLALPQLRTQLNDTLLAGKYITPLGEISFTPEGEIVQKQFFVAQIKMEPDGNSGKFTFIQ